MTRKTNFPKQLLASTSNLAIVATGAGKETVEQWFARISREAAQRATSQKLAANIDPQTPEEVAHDQI